jgi:hypothetical protein
MAPHGVQHAQRAHDIRLDEGLRGIDRAVDVALRRKIDDRIYRVLRENAGNQCLVGYVALHENVPGVARDISEVRGVSGVGQLVQIDDPAVRALLLQELPDEIAPDETAAACDEDVHDR